MENSHHDSQAPRQTMIPRAMPKAKSPSPASPEAQPTVLLVAAEGDDFSVCQYLLEREGIKVVHGRTYREGLEMARHDQPQLVVVDTTLSDGSGYEFALELKLLPALAKAPVVGISAFTSHEDAPEPSQEVFAACLTKPIQRETFTTTIRDLLEHQVTRAIKRRRDRLLKMASPHPPK